MAENIPDNKPKTVRRPRLKLPFDNRKEDAGVWAYDHRIGLCVTIIAYLVLMIAFVSSKIVVGRRPHTQGMFIDLQTLAELEQERDRLERLAREFDIPNVVRLMKRFVPEYHSQNSRFEIYDRELEEERTA